MFNLKKIQKEKLLVSDLSLAIYLVEKLGEDVLPPDRIFEGPGFIGRIFKGPTFIKRVSCNACINFRDLHRIKQEKKDCIECKKVQKEIDEVKQLRNTYAPVPFEPEEKLDRQTKRILRLRSRIEKGELDEIWCPKCHTKLRLSAAGNLIKISCSCGFRYVFISSLAGKLARIRSAVSRAGAQ